VGEAGDAVAEQYGAFRDHGPSYAYDSGGVQMGVDLLRRTADDGSRNMAGFYLGYGELRSRVNAVYGGRSGRTTLEGTSLGVYWTHKDEKNRYLDAVLQASRYDVTGVFDQGRGFSTDGSSYSASVEVGAPFRLDDHWRLEPQGQLIYQHVAVDQTQDAFGLVDYEDAEALYGRLGARLARNWVSSSGMNRMAWARFNVWHDFDNQATTQISSLAGNDPVALQTDLGGTWGQLQLAVSSQLDQRFSVFASGDYNFAFEDGRGDGFGGRIGLRMVW
ncbi:MAG TPA: autotransporter outer membrane beta-barrel domain-containing protein, partial [Brevundimonas sp.]|nr:autotransporter outer membrane beta-barrel domain-containing protein [Brevundimonas sp.]